MEISYPVISFELYNELYNSVRVSNLNNGHTILIPEKHYNELLENEDYFENGCVNYFKIFLTQNEDNFTIFGKCGFVEENHIVVPEWAIKKLDIKIFDIIKAVSTNDIQNITFLKIQGENSSYSKLLNVKEIFEKELSKCLSVSIGDSIIFDHCDNNQETKVVFKVLEIKNEFDENISFGSLRDTEVKVEFEIPVDILEEQERQRIRQIEIEEEEERQRQLEIQRQKDIILERARNNQKLEDERRGFKGDGYSLKSDNENIITREEALRIMEERFKNSK